MGGKFAGVSNLDQLRAMDCWTEETPLRVVTGYHAIAKRFFDQAGFEHVALLTADGALEAAPAMGCADIILDLVSTGESTIVITVLTYHDSGYKLITYLGLQQNSWLGIILYLL
jgi:hypothetical protein